MLNALLVVAGIALCLQTAPSPSPAPADSVKITEKVKGKGAQAENGDVVALMYSVRIKGTDKVIDTNAKSAPLSFRLGGKGLIEGFQDGVRGMVVGSKRQVEVPPSKGYGDKDRGPIPANSTLIFDLELLRVDKKDVPQKIEMTVVKEGQGVETKKGNAVAFHYVGTFINGIKFDSSRDSNEPLKVDAGEGMLIPGFDQALLGMKVGEVRKVTIPYSLGYGEQGADGSIPGFATLMFEIEMVSIGK